MILISVLMFGLLTGLSFRLLRLEPQTISFTVVATLGSLGALLAAYLGVSLHFYESGDPAEFFVAVMGAFALLLAGETTLTARSRRARNAPEQKRYRF